MQKQYDPYENVLAVMNEAMDVGKIDIYMFDIIKNPQRETKVYLPVEMDDGTVKVFEGYRVQHSNIRGPFKGGSKGRPSATGRGVVISTKLLLAEDGKKLEGTKVAIQGCGNVGGNTARIFSHRKAIVVAMSDVSGGIYSAGGLDADAITTYVENGGLLADYKADDVEHISNQDVLLTECDVLIPAALENQINEEVAGKLKCKYIVEGANGPTTVEADKVLADRDIKLVPDIFSNSGGVIVSYFEWVQNIQELT